MLEYPEFGPQVFLFFHCTHSLSDYIESCGFKHTNSLLTFKFTSTGQRLALGSYLIHPAPWCLHLEICKHFKHDISTLELLISPPKTTSLAHFSGWHHHPPCWKEEKKAGRREERKKGRRKEEKKVGRQVGKDRKGLGRRPVNRSGIL